MSTRFEAELPLKMIHAHPKNPRHTAVADDEMVASILEQGLLQAVVVAPHPNKAGEYVLIAGHRRRDGSIKAKRKHVPAIIREDLATEGQQIEAMIVENGHRQDLSPIEEAEGYEQLTLLGYKQTAIAAAVGRNVKTIRTRLGLLKLSDTTKAKVHDGQLTLEDAVAIGEYADDPETTKKLEKAAAGGSLRYELGIAKQRREALTVAAAKVARLVDAGAKPYELPKGVDIWQLRRDGVLDYIPNYDEPTWAEHAGHLGYHEHARGGVPNVDVLCLAPGDHKVDEPKKTKAQAENEAAEQKRREEHEAKRAAEQAAQAARAATLLDLVGTGTKLAPALRDLVRALLPYLLMHPECEDALKAYQDALDLPEADRWSSYWWGSEADKNKTLAAQHLAELPKMGDGALARGLVGALAGMAETYLTTFDANEKIDLELVGSYYSLLSEAGYVNSPPDEKIQETLREAWAAQTDDEPTEAAS